MEDTICLLKERENYLDLLKARKETALETAPEGALRVNCHENRIQYYKRTDAKDLNGVYIRDQEVQTAQKLAQKDYDQKVLRAVEKELGFIRRTISSYPAVTAEKVYDRLHMGRKKLVTPILEPEDRFVHRWKALSYDRKGFAENTPEFYTAQGERVRSKSEIMIADQLYRNGIPYRIECPLHLKGMGKIHPDFTVLNIKQRKEMWWEHLGMMDDPDYAEKALKRISAYEQNGIFVGESLILTYETRQNPLNQKRIMLMIQHYLLE